MSCALVKKDGKYLLLLKGAPDFLIKEGMKYESESGVADVNKSVYDNILAQLSTWSDKCYRNIALC